MIGVLGEKFLKEVGFPPIWMGWREMGGGRREGLEDEGAQKDNHDPLRAGFLRLSCCW